MPYRYLWHKCPSLECIIVENITGGFNHGLSKEKNKKTVKTKYGSTAVVSCQFAPYNYPTEQGMATVTGKKQI